MTKQQLIDFMIKKGNERKRDQCEAAQTLTQDAQDRITPIVEALQARIHVKQEKIDQITK